MRFPSRREFLYSLGSLALAPLDRDPLREDPFSLIKIPVERTMVGGRWVFES